MELVTNDQTSPPALAILWSLSSKWLFSLTQKTTMTDHVRKAASSVTDIYNTVTQTRVQKHGCLSAHTSQKWPLIQFHSIHRNTI